MKPIGSKLSIIVHDDIGQIFLSLAGTIVCNLQRFLVPIPLSHLFVF